MLDGLIIIICNGRSMASNIKINMVSGRLVGGSRICAMSIGSAPEPAIEITGRFPGGLDTK